MESGRRTTKQNHSNVRIIHRVQVVLGNSPNNKKNINNSPASPAKKNNYYEYFELSICIIKFFNLIL